MPNVLATPPKYFRAAKASGAKPRVDRAGGYRKAGLISGVSVITRGEALGHEMWIDDAFLAQVEKAINAEPKGVKSRWTHPSLSGDGMGKVTSRIRDAETSESSGQVLADQHFLEIGHKAPDGDLATYQMDLADEDPESYGLSIVFALDEGEMQRFTSEHTDEDGNFTSPDPDNASNFPHARLAELRGADAVDDPAANPNGLFAREADVAREADQLAAFALGLSKRRPAVVALGLDPDRVRGFAARFLATHKLEVKPMAAANSTPAKSEDPATDPEKNVDPADNKPAEGAPTESPPVAAGRADAARFLAAFGDQGAVWFAQGKSWEDALALQAQSVTARQVAAEKALGDRLTAIEARFAAGAKANGEGKPVGFQASDAKTRKGFASKLRFSTAPAPVPVA